MSTENIWYWEIYMSAGNTVRVSQVTSQKSGLLFQNRLVLTGKFSCNLNKI